MKAAPPFFLRFPRARHKLFQVCLSYNTARLRRGETAQRTAAKKNQNFPRKFRGKGLTICCFAAIIEMRIGKNRPRKIKIFYKEATTVDDRSRGDDKPGLTVFSADAPFVCCLL